MIINPEHPVHPRPLPNEEPRKEEPKKKLALIANGWDAAPHLMNRFPGEPVVVIDAQGKETLVVKDLADFPLVATPQSVRQSPAVIVPADQTYTAPKSDEWIRYSKTP